MNRSRLVLFGLSLVALSLLVGPVRAGLVSWSYKWNPGAPAVLSDGGSSTQIALTNEPTGVAVGTSDIVATNLKTFSGAAPTAPATFTHAAYSLNLTLVDHATLESASMTFTGELNGTASSGSANITNLFTGSTTQSATLGGNLYTIIMDGFTPPPPPGATNLGSISARAIVSLASDPPPTTNPGPGSVSDTPEPSTLVLAGTGFSLFGLWWRGRSVNRLAKKG